eukprot:TRINITY_DN23207_c0_g1_i1.p1 TRINITY_DN23207_c0_g1~~TRINITY_DN23207_c0_g1_i1.p1  ORF type:complete len:243 (+),score=71.54 TRINITY_DN23207_c0_g1_i1:36-764(+)
MGDFRQDQLDELEALESIYSEEIDIIDSNPHRFTIPVKTDDYDEEEETGRFVLLKFTLPKEYPSVAPEVDFEESLNLDEDNLDTMLDEFIKEQIQENLDMPMIFTIVSAAIEWLGETNDRLKREAVEAAERRKEEEEEAERKKLEGTKVTIESFLAWKADFDRERLEKISVVEKTGKEKLSGKELFMTDKTLNDSDIKFLANTGDTAITVDESLFEDLDDLDLDEELEDSDDPDFDPGDISD